MKKRFVLISILCLVLTPLILAAPDYIISNSEDWQDVYSTVLYANLLGLNSDFLVSTAHGPILLNGINKEYSLLIVSSKDNPFVFNYPDLATAEGFKSIEEIEISSANLDLINRIPDIKNFIVVGDSYGYNSIAVVAYALETNSWVFLTNRANIDDIDSILNARNINNLILYGYVDSEVTDTLSKYNPEIINTGDRFEDNVEIVKKYSEMGSISQVILSNGEFIEKEIMQGKNPLLFTGRENVPDKIAEYIKSSDIEIGVLIGNDLIGAATNIRQSTGINVMVKFARSARERTSGISPVEGLDLFYIPVPNLNLSIYSIRYNKATSTLEVTYRSNSNMPAYFKGTITLITSSGNIRVGDLQEVFIAPEDFKTVVYDGVEVPEENLSADVFVLYGESPSSLDRILQGRYEVEIVNILDKCELDIKRLKYNNQQKAFIIKLRNLGNVECWATVELKDVIINRLKQTIGSETSERIPSGRSKRIFVYQTLSYSDLDENNFVRVISYYGERRDSLVNVLEKRFELDYQRFNLLTYIIFILTLIILIFVIFLIIARRKEKEDD
ncbi:MAG TPA: hypothetical protein VJ438_02555 [Candidatus Nanoarchaeia archaeon]|nr:hypothetical protein [Candidatus Nanoarchaeia archaeon]